MKVEFRESFAKDLRKVRDRALLKKVDHLIKLAEAADNSAEIPNLKKLGGTSGFFRVRLGEYRVGVIISGQLLTFVRILHRKEIYRYFP